MSGVPRLSVVVATYNRPRLLERLLSQLAQQTLARDDYEVVVVDDGSVPPVSGALPPLSLPLALTLLEVPNGGAATARDLGVRRAQGAIVVILDDDMQVGPGFLAAHLALHDAGARRVVLGHIRPDPGLARMPLFERYHAAMLDRWVAGVRDGKTAIQGSDLCTGNVSFPRAEYLEVGGFDPSLRRSEDAEIGVRFQKAGLHLVFGSEAFSLHGSDHSRLAVWMQRAYLYGVFDRRIARKHPEVASADPHRFFSLVHPLSRPFLVTAAVAPALGYVLARVAILASLGVDRLGLERLGIAGATLAYGIEYFRGVRAEAGSARATLRPAAVR